MIVLGGDNIVFFQFHLLNFAFSIQQIFGNFADTCTELRQLQPQVVRFQDPSVGGEGIYNLDNELCPSKPGVPEMELRFCRERMDALKSIGVDYWFIVPYDNGGCTCAQCAPWGTNGFLRMAEPLARAYRRAYPKGKVILGTWYFDRWADDYGGKFPTYPLVHGSPGGLPPRLLRPAAALVESTFALRMVMFASTGSRKAYIGRS